MSNNWKIEGNHVNPKAKKELNAFLETWLKNLIDQGFKLEKEKAVCEG